MRLRIISIAKRKQSFLSYFQFFLNSDPVITMYYAPDEDENYEKPPVGPIFLWGQAVFIIAQLLTSGLLHINELDTIRRYLPSYNRPRKGGRYSAFQVCRMP